MVSNAGESGAREGVSTFRSLRYRDFRFFWTGILAIGAGQWMEQIVIGWQVLELTDSPFWVAAVNGVRGVPFLLGAPVAGLLADRFPRKTVLLTGLSAVTVIAAIATGLNFSGVVELWHVFLLSFALGLAWSVQNPSRHALIPSLVPRRDLLNAISLTNIGFQVSRTTGPFVAGALLAVLGFGEIFAIITAAYVTVLVSIFMIRVSETRTQQVASMRRNLADGVAYIRRTRPLFALLIFAFIPVAIGMPYFAVVPVFAEDVLDVGEFGYGLLLASAGLGALLSSFLLASVGRIRRPVLVQTACVLTFAATLVAFGLSRDFILSLVVLLLAGGAQTVFMTLNNTQIQMIADDAMRGRVLSVVMMQWGMTPLSFFAVGIAAETLSPSIAVIGMGSIIVVATGVFFWVFPWARNLDSARTGEANLTAETSR